MKSPEVIIAAIWDILCTTDRKDPQSRSELVEGLHRIAVATLQALAAAEDMAPDETIELCRRSTLWPQLIAPMNDSQASYRLDSIRAHLGKATGLNMIPARKPGTAAAFSLQWYHVLECERRNHLWENLSDYGKAQYARAAEDGQTPEECFAEFKSANYPEWEKKTVIDPVWKNEPALFLEDIRWIYAAGLLEPLTQENTGEWAEAATLYLESLSPDGDLMRSPLVPQVVIDPGGLRAATNKATKREQRAAEESARKDTRRELKKKLNKGFKGIACES